MYGVQSNMTTNLVQEFPFGLRVSFWFKVSGISDSVSIWLASASVRCYRAVGQVLLPAKNFLAQAQGRNYCEPNVN